GTDLLDVACGPGYVAAAASALGARSTGLDFAPNMVRLASSNYPTLAFRQGDAEALPFEAGAFDAVTINFGILHFPDADRALAEAFRVLRPGGRLAFTAWAESDRSAIAIAMAAITDHGRLDVDLPAGTPLFRFADHAECARTLAGGGYRDVVSRDHELVWRLPRPFALMEVFREATARLSGLLGAQDPEALPKISAAMTAGCQRFVDGDLALLPMPCVLTAAQKP
ncbi:MAG: class I SAM-dependent methyltransferase, partial [Gammaproteobacteria bacterium]|nr:class I SAM-dependent methyltransferase [Gammaproteobacteria bacterium]